MDSEDVLIYFVLGSIILVVIIIKLLPKFNNFKDLIAYLKYTGK